MMLEKFPIRCFYHTASCRKKQQTGQGALVNRKKKHFQMDDKAVELADSTKEALSI